MQDLLLQEDGTRILQENTDKVWTEQQGLGAFLPVGASSINTAN